MSCDNSEANTRQTGACVPDSRLLNHTRRMRPELLSTPTQTMSERPGKARILVVEDEEAIRDLICFHLDLAGYAFETVADGKEALAIAARRAFDVVVLDILLPNLDGMTLCQASDSVILTVTNAGDGIAPDQLPFIFDRFFKASSVKGVASRGSGLGLSIVKAIVTRHGGHVSATSTPNLGTTIRIELPASPRSGGMTEVAHSLPA
jgi:signal transduction histidine kinase